MYFAKAWYFPVFRRKRKILDTDDFEQPAMKRSHDTSFIGSWLGDGLKRSKDTHDDDTWFKRSREAYDDDKRGFFAHERDYKGNYGKRSYPFNRKDYFEDNISHDKRSVYKRVG